MTPVNEVATQILPKVFPEAKHFAYKIKEDYQKLDKLPITKVESVSEKNVGYASNKYFSRDYKIQVMVFININETEIESVNDMLDRGLESEGYIMAYGEDRPHEKYDHVQVITRQYKKTRRKY